MNRMDDLISRQAAIDAVSRGCQVFGIFAECEKNLNALPSAERHGRWIPYGLEEGFAIERHSCSVCDYDIGVLTTPYCPMCGAKMDEVEDEQTEPRYCDRNICTENEYNGVSCDECEIAKNYNLEDDDSPCLDCEEV